jgi:hypothetical protein
MVARNEKSTSSEKTKNRNERRFSLKLASKCKICIDIDDRISSMMASISALRNNDDCLYYVFRERKREIILNRR